MAKKYLAAVSGGPDSMVMLDIYKHNIAVVCHVNYQKRASANRDQKIVEEFCKKNNLVLKTLVVKKSQYKNSKANFQNFARQIRYDFFCKIGSKNNLNTILTAHQRDDHLETAYYQMKRNSKALFYGIKKNSKYKDLLVYRPLINKTKSWILDYAKENNINFGIDETNFEDIYERNKIRKLLQLFSKDELKNFMQKINNYNKQNQKILKMVEKNYRKWKNLSFSTIFFNKIPKSLISYIIYKLLSDNEIPNPSASKIQQVVTFINKARINKEQRLGNKFYIVKSNCTIKVLKKDI